MNLHRYNKTNMMSQKKSNMENINTLGERILDYMRLQKVPNMPTEANDMLSLVRDLLDVSIDYFFHGRYTLHSILIKDEAEHIFSPEVALHFLRNPFVDIELFPCQWCKISHLSSESLSEHMRTDHQDLLLSKPFSSRPANVLPESPKQPTPSTSSNRGIKREPQETTIPNKPKKAKGAVSYQMEKTETIARTNNDISSNPETSDQNTPTEQHSKSAAKEIEESASRGEASNQSTSSDVSASSSLIEVRVKQEKDVVDLTEESEIVGTKFVCCVCSKEIITSDGGISHLQKEHGIALSSTENWPCSHCSATFASNNDLYKHFSEQHATVDTEHWICFFCSQVFVHRHKFTLHMMTHSLMQTAMPPGVADWVCILCHTSEHDPADIVLHMNQHHLEKVVSDADVVACPRCKKHGLSCGINEHLKAMCVECEERFCKTSEMVEHMVMVHGEGQGWRCVHCGICLSNKHSLKRHIFTQHMREVWPCPECNENAFSKQYLTNHLINLHRKPEREARRLVNQLELD